MINVRKNAMRKYHELVHTKKYMEQSPKKFPITYKYMSKEDWESEKQRYEIVCGQIELLKEILQIK